MKRTFLIILSLFVGICTVIAFIYGVEIFVNFLDNHGISGPQIVLTVLYFILAFIVSHTCYHALKSTD